LVDARVLSLVDDVLISSQALILFIHVAFLDLCVKADLSLFWIDLLNHNPDLVHFHPLAITIIRFDHRLQARRPRLSLSSTFLYQLA
jgi:hypothetical protein